MAFRQVGDSRRQRADQVLHAFRWLTVGRRCSLKERLERHSDDLRRPASKAAGCPPERAPQRRRQTDSDLIVHEGALRCVHCNCSATHCNATRSQSVAPSDCPFGRLRSVLPPSLDADRVALAARRLTPKARQALAERRHELGPQCRRGGEAVGRTARQAALDDVVEPPDSE